MLGDPQDQVMLMSLQFYGATTYHGLVNPSNRVTFNPRFADLAGVYGFIPRACRHYRPQTKGKDERMVGYLKQHFFVCYPTFTSWEHLNQHLTDWLRDETDQRIHGALHEKVAGRFACEAPTLRPLPATRPTMKRGKSAVTALSTCVEIATAFRRN